ncbi:hypothetical protein [Treponema sp. R80B11-R83G3]
MAEQNTVNKSPLYSLIPIDDFKAVLGIDDREDKLSKFCLVTSTLTIEQYCKRKLLRKKYFENNELFEGLHITLKEYPVSEILALYALGSGQLSMNVGELIEPDFYRIYPDCGTDDDIPFTIEFSPAVARMGCKVIKVVYLAGYEIRNEKLEMRNEETETNDEQEDLNDNREGRIFVPADLQAACLELASWNMNRYKGRRIGMSGNIKGAGIQGEHFELSMPENVKILLEPYRRKTI